MKTVMPSVAQLQRKHVVLELECIDRMYLNAYIPKLTSAAGVAGFFTGGKATSGSVSHYLVGETGAEKPGTQKDADRNRQRRDAIFQHRLIFQWLLAKSLGGAGW